jgi:integrase
MGPKTASSHRTIPLPSYVVVALAEHLRLHPREPGEYLLRAPAGHPLGSDQFGYYWRRACKAANAPNVRYHDLRHTYASLLLSRGVSIKAVADWLGHASPTTTLRIYAHLMPADEDVARAVLDSVLAPSAEDQLRTIDTPETL